MIELAAHSVVEQWGWIPGNAGENRIIAALHVAGVAPEEMQQQFRIGPYRLDFAWPTHRVAIEADGWVHTTQHVKKRDEARDAHLLSWGWLVCRFDVDMPEDALRAEVRRLVQQIPRLCIQRAQGEIDRL